MAPGGNTSLDQNGDGYGDGILQQTFKSSSAVCNFGYYFFQGTSMATPHVSGVAALLISAGSATPDQVRAALQNTAKDLGATGWDSTFGWGLVDAFAALNYTGGPTPPPPPPTPTVCWDGNNAYLSRNSQQARKFCKCAQGTYGYLSYNSVFGRRTAYKYVDSGNNTNWQVTPVSSSSSISQVTCSDGKTYPTNQTYYYNQ